jgi:hypothetical protein
MPTGSTWARVGERKIVRFESPCGRRVNVVGAWAPFEPTGPRLLFETRPAGRGAVTEKYDGAAHLHFVERVAGLPDGWTQDIRRSRPCVMVVDNYSVHHSAVVKERTPALQAAGVRFFFLPPDSPELNQIESVWRQVKHQDLPERRYPTLEELEAAVSQALGRRAALGSTKDLPASA